MKFTYNPRIIRHLGYELITSDEVAITELIKNSYDAKAPNVTIQFLSGLDNLDLSKLTQPIPEILSEQLNENPIPGLVVIEDDGKGMTYTELQKGFFEVGTTVKKEEKEKSEETDDNIILGDKGIGRLAAQRIAPILIVESITENNTKVNIVKVTWEEFINNKEFDAPEWTPDRTEQGSYTRLWLLGTPDIPVQIDKYYEKREVFEIEDLFGNPGKSLGNSLFVKDDLQTALSFLYSPFEEKKSTINLDISANGEQITLDFNYQALKVAESIHSFKTETILDDEGNPKDLKFTLEMKLRPWFLERIHHRELGNVLYQDWKKSPTEYKEFYNKYKDYYDANLKDSFLLSEVEEKWKEKWIKKRELFPDNFVNALLKVAPIKGEIHTFKRDNTLMSMARRSAIDNKYIDNTTRINFDIRPFLEAHNGIKLYRNSFRIATIGNKDNDWLQFQQKRTVGQQFYRFELGNVIGFIKINDPKQRYIYETSSREHLTQNEYVDSLQIALSEVLDIFSPGYTKTAVELTKNFLDQEGWLPENTDEQIKEEVDKSKEILAAAKKNLAAIQEAITAIKDNIDLDTEDKINSVKKVFGKLEPVTLNFEQNLDDTQRSLKSANQLLEVAKQEQIRIKTEAYNNYKLMANGLVTEIITHELHSLLSSSEEEAEKYEKHFTTIENHFLDNEEFDINNSHFLPIKDKFDHLYKRMGDLDKFYSFLEKTFITSEGNRALNPANVKEELEIIVDRFKFRLNRHNVEVDLSSVNNTWEVPKGALLHVFYNLIDNSIYWIRQRQKFAKKDNTYIHEGIDKIVIKTTSPNTLQVEDTGTGVLEKYQHTLFNELVSGRDNGRGMGLYIVRQFLKSFGGEIELLPITNSYGNRYIFELRMQNRLEEDE
ncbi:sensor histidine kinase [Echinicola salinicaeni]|uniref:sensor histidine kinase n=1 Tax=Echinicola salinicaeni TaxID=2762757 RepID=UPI001647EBFD|nr:ATP-binding protein [Echinicola salinicaeni]